MGKKEQDIARQRRLAFENQRKAERRMQLRSEINELNAKKQQYENMNTKIQQAITQLTNAKTNANNAYTQFRNSYQSDTATKESQKLNNISYSITNTIASLQSIIADSNQKLTQIRYNISIKEYEFSHIV